MCSLEKRGNLFLLTLTGDGVDEHHHLDHTLISAIRKALSNAKLDSTPGSVFITVAQGKFFSNGFDLKTTSPSMIVDTLEMFKNLIADFVSFPMPTIAVITGHAVGTGLGLAICHDYVLMRRDRGFLYVSEIHMGTLLPDFAVELLRSKVEKPKYRHDILLRGVKVKADEAVVMGLVDMVYEDQSSAVQGGILMGIELGKMKWDGEVYAGIRKSLYPELCSLLGLMGFKKIIKPRL